MDHRNFLKIAGVSTFGLFASLFVVLCGCSANQYSIEGEKMALVYETEFSNPADIKDWVMEGPGEIEIKDGKLIMTPFAQQAIYDKWESLGRKVLDPRKEYSATVEEELKRTGVYPHINKLRNSKGQLIGGHIVAWNSAFTTGGDYVVEYDFKPLSPVGLGIIFFSATGSDGSDVLSKHLKDRYGVFNSYVRGDIDCYHVSYWANNAGHGFRKTCNLRKNSGFFNLANGPDPSIRDLDYSDEKFKFKKHRIRLEKIKNRIAFYVDGELAIEFFDNRINNTLDADGNLKEKNVDTGEVLAGGRIGLRQMVGLKAEYSNFKVYKVKE